MKCKHKIPNRNGARKEITLEKSCGSVLSGVLSGFQNQFFSSGAYDLISPLQRQTIDSSNRVLEVQVKHFIFDENTKLTLLI